MAKYDPNCAQYPELPHAVVHQGVVICYLNHNLLELLELRDVSPDRVLELKELHCRLYEVYRAMEATDSVWELRKLAKCVTGIEFAQQRAWGFQENENFHRWFEVPKCLCPKMDNTEQLGTLYRLIYRDCPIHGSK